MRVTTNTFPNSLVDELAKLTTRQSRLQNQAATGQRIRLPEDDPAAVRRVLDFQAGARSVGQYQKNISEMHDLAEASYGQIKALKTLCDRAREIATLADGTKSSAELSSYTIEVSQLIQQAVHFANGKFRGEFLFAGTKSDQSPFVATFDTNGLVTGVTYQGNSSAAENEIAAGVTLSGQTVGSNAAGSGPRGLVTDSRGGADFFSHLISLQNNLSSRNVAAVASSDQPQLARDEENFLFHFATVGTIMERLETTASLASQQADSLERNVSEEADADLAQTLVRLNQTQTAYQAALQSGARILGHSLLDYLR
jgi:flagellar hook-associated protein 3 FlgL